MSTPATLTLSLEEKLSKKTNTVHPPQSNIMKPVFFYLKNVDMINFRTYRDLHFFTPTKEEVDKINKHINPYLEDGYETPFFQDKFTSAETIVFKISKSRERLNEKFKVACLTKEKRILAISCNGYTTRDGKKYLNFYIYECLKA